jgi:ribosome modulation factor
LNFLTVFGGEFQPKQEEEPITTKTARAAGRETGRAGKSATLNPHGRGSDLHAAWAEGWQEGMADNLPCKAEADDGPFVTTRH